MLRLRQRTELRRKFVITSCISSELLIQECRSMHAAATDRMIRAEEKHKNDSEKKIAHNQI